MLHRRKRELIVAGLLGLALTGTVLTWMLWPGERVKSQQAVDPVAVQPVLQQLGPGTTFHMVDVVYRRYGPAAADVPSSEGPETRRIEYWISFDAQGALAALVIETRGTNGTLLTTGTLDGADLVFRDANGVETDRQANVRAGMTVDGVKASISTAITKSHEALLSHPNTPASEMMGRSVEVLEDRRPFRSGVPVATAGTGYEIPYVADLRPAEETRRSYVLLDEFRTIRSEVGIVSDDGTETIVESRDHEVFEVIAAVP